jgi:hypothetical protein
MRSLAGLLVFVAVSFRVYEVYVKRMPVTDKGTTPTQAIDLVGVRTDLLQIAQAERAYLAINGECVNIEELATSNTLTIIKTERDGYFFSVACSGQDFTVTAKHAPAAPNSSIRYPVLAIDQNMEIAEVH